MNDPYDFFKEIPDDGNDEQKPAFREEKNGPSDGGLEFGNLSDDFVIGQDFFINDTGEASEVPESHPSMASRSNAATRKKKKKKKSNTTSKGCLGAVIWLALILVTAIGLSAVIIYLGSDYLGISTAAGSAINKEIVIPKGTTTHAIADKLEDEGIIKSSLFFRLYAKSKHFDSKFQYGIYYFCRQDSYEDIAEALTKEGEHADEVRVTIPEGYTVDQIAELLKKNGICSEEDFKTAVNEATAEKYNFKFMSNIAMQNGGVHYRLEGYLFPDTYFFYNTGDKAGAEQAIKKMLQNLDDKFTAEMYERANATGHSVHEILTMASIIEMEAGVGSYEEKQKVSAVFWNRINVPGNETGGKLQSDPTKNYKYNKDRYDTYEITGLAPGAYCSPGLESIMAALYPDETCKALYFVTDKDMKFYYNNTLSEHNKTINSLKKSGKWAK